MDNGTLIVVGLVIAVVAALGLGFALFGFAVSLRNSNRRRRSGLSDEYHSTRPPSISSTHNEASRTISFGEISDIEQSSNYPQDAYIDIRQSVPVADKCPTCRTPVYEGDGVVCPKCSSHYHFSCFNENKNICENCKWVQS